jgi:hypothetical protein
MPTKKERKAAARTGAALPDAESGGRYPVRNKEDLRKAIRAVGRSTKTSHSVVRKHIIRRARALGLSSMIPDTWSSNGTLKSDS